MFIHNYHNLPPEILNLTVKSFWHLSSGFLWTATSYSAKGADFFGSQTFSMKYPVHYILIYITVLYIILYIIPKICPHELIQTAISQL